MTTIFTAGALWLDGCALEQLERATIRSYRNHLTHHIEPKIGSLLLDELTAVDVREFLDNMLRDSTRAMAKKCLTSLRSLISEAQQRGLVQHNVARDVKLRRSQRHEPERVFPTKDEIRALLSNAPARHQPLMFTAVFTGMRMSELRGLSWTDVDMDRGVLRVRQRADRYNVLSVPKSKAGRREIPLGSTAVRTLREWRCSCPRGSLDLVFPNGAGNVESHWNIYNRVFVPLMLRCQITKADNDNKPRFSLHSLRHAAASLFIEQGWPPKKIQVMLGHSSITMTYDVYGHLFHDPAKDVQLMEKMEQDLLAA